MRSLIVLMLSSDVALALRSQGDSKDIDDEVYDGVDVATQLVKSSAGDLDSQGPLADLESQPDSAALQSPKEREADRKPDTDSQQIVAIYNTTAMSLSLLERNQAQALYVPESGKKCKKQLRVDVKRRDRAWTSLDRVESKIVTCARWCTQDNKCEAFTLFWRTLPPADGTIAFCNHCASTSSRGGVSKNWYFYGPPFEPESDNTLRSPSTRGSHPMAACKGHCESDSDCAGELKCYKRGNSNDDVPGCAGLAKRGHDYCYRPSPSK